MSKDKVDEIKDRLKVDIPVEEEPEVLKVEVDEEIDVIGELSNLGKQVADTLRTAWDSDERKNFEGEVREGFSQFVGQIDKVFKDVRGGGGETTERIKEEAAGVREQVNTGDFGKKARTGVVQGLRWLSDEVGKLADQFSGNDEDIVEATDDSAETS